MKGTPRKVDTASKSIKGHSKSPLKESSSKNSLSQSKDSLSQDPYFCHYRNAMYMGRVKVFQKDGRGILLHDDGTSAITSYQKDMLHGYNLLLTPDNSLISANYNRNKLVEVVYRTENMLFYARFNSQEQLEGSSTIINYQKKEILYANAKKGAILQKTEEKNESVLNRVLDMNNLQGIIPYEHIKNLNLDIQKGKNMEILRRGSKVTIGFTKNGFLNGIAFIIAYKVDTTTMKTENYSVQLIERGYYKNQQLNGLGQRRFKNGNVYVGEFKNDQFEGTGILKNNVKMNWVSGIFERGNLVQLGKYSNDGQDKNSQRILQSIHQRKTSWVSKDINLTSSVFLDKQIEKIQNFKNNEQMINLEVRRQQMLRRIQQNFIIDGQEEGQEAPLRKVQGLLDSPLQKYLRTQAQNSDFKEQPNQGSFDSRRLSSSRRNRIFTQQSFKNDLREAGNQYRLQILPVPIDNMYSSRKSRQEQEPLASKSFRLIEPRSGSPPKEQQSKQDSQRKEPKQLTGPRVQIFSTAEKPKQQRRSSRSPNISYSASDMKKRKEDIIESMYRRELKRSLI